MPLRPIGNRILVRREKPAEKVGNILIPDTAKKKLFRGTVLTVGPGVYTPEGKFLPTCPTPKEYPKTAGMMSVPPEAVPGVKAGDTLIFGEWSGHEVEDGPNDGVTLPKLVVLEEDDVLLVVELDEHDEEMARQDAASRAG